MARAGGPNALFLFAAALDTIGSVCGPKIEALSFKLQTQIS